MLYRLAIFATVIFLAATGLVTAQQFDLSIPVDKNGEPNPVGVPFKQYFNTMPKVFENTVIEINGHNYLYKTAFPGFAGIQKHNLPVILWEIEKKFKCETFRLNKLQNINPPRSSLKSDILEFIQTNPADCKNLASSFYLWQLYGSGQAIRDYDLPLILEKLGEDGKRYAIYANESRRGMRPMSPVTAKTVEKNQKTTFEELANYIRKGSAGYQPEKHDFEQVKIMQMLEQKSPTDIVKYLLANNIIKRDNFYWLVIFLKMCPEWPPEAVEFMKKNFQTYKNDDYFACQMVYISAKNPEMVNWLKPFMKEFAKSKGVKSDDVTKDGNREVIQLSFNGTMSPGTAAAYAFISGETDLTGVAKNYCSDRRFFVYEYAAITGKYNEACQLMEKIDQVPITQDFQTNENTKVIINQIPFEALYDKSDLTKANRIMILKNIFDYSGITVVVDNVVTSFDTNKNSEELERLTNIRRLHQDNLPALLELAQIPKYSAAAWQAISIFPIKAFTTEQAAKYFTYCKLNSRATDGKVALVAIQRMRNFINDEQRGEAVKSLFELLLSEDLSRSRVAEDSIRAMGNACLPELLQYVGGKEPYYAVRACQFIADMGLYGNSASAELGKYLNSNPDWSVKTAIIKALAQINGTATIPEIEKCLTAKQPALAETARQALLLLKPVAKEALNGNPDDYFATLPAPRSPNMR